MLNICCKLQLSSQIEVATSATINISNGNLRFDLDYSDADSHLFKAQLVTRFKGVMNQRCVILTAARDTGFSQPEPRACSKATSTTFQLIGLRGMLAQPGCEEGAIVRPAEVLDRMR